MKYPHSALVTIIVMMVVILGCPLLVVGQKRTVRTKSVTKYISQEQMDFLERFMLSTDAIDLAYATDKGRFVNMRVRQGYKDWVALPASLDRLAQNVETAYDDWIFVYGRVTNSGLMNSIIRLNEQKGEPDSLTPLVFAKYRLSLQNPYGAINYLRNLSLIRNEQFRTAASTYRLRPEDSGKRAEREKADADAFAKKKAAEEEAQRKLAEETKAKLLDEAKLAELQRCKLTIDQAPVIKGFHLGMTSDVVVSRFIAPPGRMLLNNERSELIFNREYSKLPNFRAWDYPNIRSFHFTIVDHRVIAIVVAYENPAKYWTDTNSFLGVLSGTLTIPKFWQNVFTRGYGSGEVNGFDRLAKCEGWTLFAYGGQYDGQLGWKDDRSEEEYTRRKESEKKALEQRMRDAFKPN